MTVRFSDLTQDERNVLLGDDLHYLYAELDCIVHGLQEKGVYDGSGFATRLAASLIAEAIRLGHRLVP